MGAYGDDDASTTVSQVSQRQERMVNQQQRVADQEQQRTADQQQHMGNQQPGPVVAVQQQDPLIEALREDARQSQLMVAALQKSVDMLVTTMVNTPPNPTPGKERSASEEDLLLAYRTKKKREAEGAFSASSTPTPSPPFSSSSHQPFSTPSTGSYQSAEVNHLESVMKRRKQQHDLEDAEEHSMQLLLEAQLQLERQKAAHDLEIERSKNRQLQLNSLKADKLNRRIEEYEDLLRSAGLINQYQPQNNFFSPK